MNGGDYFPCNRNGHDSEAVLKEIMEDIKSFPKGTPLEHHHKEYFSIFRRLLDTLDQHERVKQAMQEHFGTNQSGQQTVATPVASPKPKPTPKPTPTNQMHTMAAILMKKVRMTIVMSTNDGMHGDSSPYNDNEDGNDNQHFRSQRQ
jgi:hypothetical protein